MFLVGITGGIGSGKTTVCKIFEVLGVPVYYADERAKWLLNNDATVKEKVVALLGNDAYSNGELNRPLIAEKVFADKNLLEQYNAIVHPAVAEDTLTWNSQHLDEPYVLKEAALLVETGSYLNLDKLIVVTAPENIRIERVMQRDGLSEAAVTARIKNQMPESEKVKLADFVIVNDGTQSLIEQVKNIHQEIMVMAYR
jgi:dephospho-CoA kinase